MSEKKTCYNCKETIMDESYKVPTGSAMVLDNTMEVKVWNDLCYGCFIEYSGFDNEGRPAVVQLYKPQTVLLDKLDERN